MSFIFSGLLHYMCQLMCQQPSPLAHPRRILPCPEHNILPKGKGTGIDRLGYVGCPSVTVYTHVAEIRVEARFEEGLFGRGQWVPFDFDGLDITPHFQSDLWSRTGENFLVGFLLPPLLARPAFEPMK